MKGVRSLTTHALIFSLLFKANIHKLQIGIFMPSQYG